MNYAVMEDRIEVHINVEYFLTLSETEMKEKYMQFMQESQDLSRSEGKKVVEIVDVKNISIVTAMQNVFLLARVLELGKDFSHAEKTVFINAPSTVTPFVNKIIHILPWLKEKMHIEFR